MSNRRLVMLALFGATLLGMTCCVPTPGSLTLVAKPGTLDAGAQARLTVTASESDGTIGQGSVSLTTTKGTLGAAALTLDGFGSAVTTFECADCPA